MPNNSPSKLNILYAIREIAGAVLGLALIAVPFIAIIYWSNHTAVTSYKTESVAVPFTYETQTDSNLSPSQSHTEPGLNGSKEVTYRVETKGGKVISKQPVSSADYSAPIPQITYVGSGVPPQAPTEYSSDDDSNSSSVRTGAECVDGTTSNATGRGACSHHGGVAEWLSN